MPICFADNSIPASPEKEPFIAHFSGDTTRAIHIPDLNYTVEISDGPYQVFVVGHKYNMPGARFQHPNVCSTVRLSQFGFKHYRRDGGKRWTYHDGVERFFIVPKEHVYLDDTHKGYSYPRLIVNGVTFTVNVSGCTINGWTDYIGLLAHTAIGMSLRDMKKIAEVSVLIPGFEPPLRNDSRLATHEELLAILAKPRYPEVGDVVITNGKPAVLTVTRVELGRNGHRTGYSGVNYSGYPYFFRPSQIKDFVQGLSQNEVIDLYLEHKDINELHAEMMRAAARGDQARVSELRELARAQL